MKALWWLANILGLGFLSWYNLAKSKEVSQNRMILKLSSLDVVSLFLLLSYFFCAVIRSVKSSFLKEKFVLSSYLVAASFTITTTLVNLVFQPFEDVFETDLDKVLKLVPFNGGLLVVALFESRNLAGLEAPSLKLLGVFEVYLGLWYGFIQYTVHKKTESFSYEVLNNLTFEQQLLCMLGFIAANMFFKYLLIESVIPKVKVKKT